MRFVNNPFTDKLDVASLNGSGAPPVETVTGNSGGAVGPNATTFNLNLLGDNTSGINVVGNPGTNTLTIFGLASSSTQIGTTRYATNAEASAQTSTTIALTPSNITSLFSTNPLPASQGGTGRSSPAAHSLLVTNGSSAFTSLGVASNGQIPIGSIASDPVLNTITAGAGVTITNGPGTITIAAGAGVPTTFTEDSGTASPAASNLNLFGSGSITTTGSGSTVTTALTGLTNHAVLVGSGTSTITKVGPTATTGQVLQNNAAGDPSYSTATYPSTTTVSQILYSSSTNVVGGLTTANQGVLTTGATGIPVITALATNGQLIIGSTAGVPAAATLTPGTGITITNGSNSITISATTSGMPWSDQSGAFLSVANNGYFITTTSTPTLPAAPVEGDEVAFIVDTTNICTITANTGQFIRIGLQKSASAGTCASNFQGDSIRLVYRATGTTWFSLSAPEGTWTIT